MFRASDFNKEIGNHTKLKSAEKKFDLQNDTDAPIDVTTVRRLLDANSCARIRIWMSICSQCGLCAESCFVYVSNDRNPRLSPAYKFSHTLGEMIRRKGKIDRAFLKQCYEISWLQCTLCKRCSMYCPFGIDVATMISISRNICYSQGVTPKQLAFFSDNCDKTGNHMGIPVEELVDTCEWMVEEVEDDYRGVKIPVDEPHVSYMYTVNPREPVYYPQDISNAAIIFAAAKESWTIPNREHNQCCGGGGGIMPMGQDYKRFRMASGKLKAEQIRETGAKIVITPCHNCFDQINDLSEKYELGIKALSLKEIIVGSMIVPDHMKIEQ